MFTKLFITFMVALIASCGRALYGIGFAPESRDIRIEVEHLGESGQGLLILRNGTGEHRDVFLTGVSCGCVKVEGHRFRVPPLGSCSVPLSAKPISLGESLQSVVMRAEPGGVVLKATVRVCAKQGCSIEPSTWDPPQPVVAGAYTEIGRLRFVTKDRGPLQGLSVRTDPDLGSFEVVLADASLVRSGREDTVWEIPVGIVGKRPTERMVHRVEIEVRTAQRSHAASMAVTLAVAANVIK